MRRAAIESCFITWYESCQTAFKECIGEEKDFEQLKDKTKTFHTKVKVSPCGTMEKYKYRDDCRFEDDRSFAARGTTRLHLDDGFQWIFHLNKFFNAHELKKKLQLSLEELLYVLQKQDFSFFSCPNGTGRTSPTFIILHKKPFMRIHWAQWTPLSKCNHWLIP